MIEKVKLKFIRLWSLNPRLDQDLRASDLSLIEDEETIVKELWDSVGYKKMLGLVNYINDKGLYEDELIIVVKNGKQYDVYDGNRRISALKYIASDSFAPEKKSYSLESEISVCVMSEEEAYERIFVKHAGDSSLRTISWNALMRDIALHNASKTPLYAKAFDLFKKEALTKSKFKLIEYTELDGALKNKTLVSIITQYANTSSLFDVLVHIKNELRFKTFSRYLIGIENDKGKKDSIIRVLNTLFSPFERTSDEQNTDDFTETQSNNDDSKDKEDVVADFFALKQKKYKSMFGRKFDIRSSLSYERKPKKVEKIEIISKNRNIVLEGDCLGSDVPPGVYLFNIFCGQYYEEIQVTIFPMHSKESNTVATNDFYINNYRSQLSISQPLAFLLRFLAETEITRDNIYALTILLRQYLEFMYKLYSERHMPSVMQAICSNLSGGINSVNNNIWLKNQSVCSAEQKKSVNDQVKTLISRVQMNSHNIETIQEAELKGLFNLLVPFLRKMTKEMTGHN